MNITNMNNNKSNLRIANRSLPLQTQRQDNNYNTTDTNSDSDSSSENNYHSDILCDTNNNDNNVSSHHRFLLNQSSPSLEDFTNTVFFALLNVQGINSPMKFETILEDLTE